MKKNCKKQIKPYFPFGGILVDVDKLVPVPAGLSKLSDVVKTDAVKKTVYEKLVAKVNTIDTSAFVLKSKCDIDKSDLEKKISDADKNIWYYSTC